MASKRESSARKAQFRLEHLDKMLDEALEETFPASDPIAVSAAAVGSEGNRSGAGGS